jgi:hypothetical protein
MRTGLIMLVLATMALPCAGQLTFASQSASSTTVTIGNSLSCNTGATAPQYHAANGYVRAYDLLASGVIGVIEVCSIRFGLEFALAGLGAPTQPAEIRLYSAPTAGLVFPAALTNFTLIHTEFLNIANTPAAATNIIIDQPITANPVVQLQPTDTLIVEFFTPDGIAAQNVLFIGSNTLGESAPTYLVAPTCGAPIPAAVTSLVPTSTMHVVLDIGYRYAGLPLALSLSSPVAGSLQVDIDGLVPSGEYFTIYSFTQCGTIGTGPYLGLCAPDINFFLPQLLLPPVVYPLHFVATSCFQTQTFTGLPSAVSLQAVTFDFTGGTLGAVSGVSGVTIN